MAIHTNTHSLAHIFKNQLSLLSKFLSNTLISKSQNSLYLFIIFFLYLQVLEPPKWPLTNLVRATSSSSYKHTSTHSLQDIEVTRPHLSLLPKSWTLLEQGGRFSPQVSTFLILFIILSCRNLYLAFFNTQA